MEEVCHVSIKEGIVSVSICSTVYLSGTQVHGQRQHHRTLAKGCLCCHPPTVVVCTGQEHSKQHCKMQAFVPDLHFCIDKGCQLEIIIMNCDGDRMSQNRSKWACSSTRAYASGVGVKHRFK